MVQCPEPSSGCAFGHSIGTSSSVDFEENNARELYFRRRTEAVSIKRVDSGFDVSTPVCFNCCYIMRGDVSPSSVWTSTRATFPVAYRTPDADGNPVLQHYFLFLDLLMDVLVYAHAFPANERMTQRKHTRPNPLFTRRSITLWDRPREIGLSRPCMWYAGIHIARRPLPMRAQGIGTTTPDCRMQ